MNSPRRSSPAPVRSTSIHLQLKTMILSGELRSGERLVERELARRLKVSRIPLRESLIRLESEGLVRSVANTATYVEDFSLDDLDAATPENLFAREPATAHRLSRPLVGNLSP